MSAFQLEKHGHLAVLTLNSAEKRNLLTPHSALAIAEAVQQLLRTAGFVTVSSKRDYAGQWRISGGQLPAANE